MRAIRRNVTGSRSTISQPPSSPDDRCTCHLVVSRLLNASKFAKVSWATRCKDVHITRWERNVRRVFDTIILKLLTLRNSNRGSVTYSTFSFRGLLRPTERDIEHSKQHTRLLDTAFLRTPSKLSWQTSKSCVYGSITVSAGEHNLSFYLMLCIGISPMSQLQLQLILSPVRNILLDRFSMFGHKCGGSSLYTGSYSSWETVRTIQFCREVFPYMHHPCSWCKSRGWFVTSSWKLFTREEMGDRYRTLYLDMNEMGVAWMKIWICKWYKS